MRTLSAERSLGAIAGLLMAMLAACGGSAASAPASSSATAPASKPAASQEAKPASPSAASAAAASSAAAKPAASAAAKPSGDNTVKIGVLGVSSEGGIYAALDKGYFSQQGVNVELQNMTGTTDQIGPLATGQIDAGHQAINAGIINAVARGVPIKIGLGVHLVYPNKPTATRIVIRKALIDGGQVKSPADLKGKTIALESRGIGQELLFVKLLQQGGLKYPDDVKVVTMPNAEMITAFANGAIDLANISDPLVARGIDQGTITDFKQLADLYPTLQLSALVFSPAFANDKADLARRFAVGYLKGVRDYTDAFTNGKDKEAVIASIIKYSSVKDRQLYDKMVPATLAVNGEVRGDDIEYQEDWYLQSGVIKEKIPASKIVDGQFAKYAVDQLGEYK